MEKRFVKVSNYNMTRIIEEVEKLIVNDGGKILENKKPYQMELECYTNETNPQKIEKLKTLPTIISNQLSNYFVSYSMYFVIDGYYYYVSYDDNPFLPMTFGKIKIDDKGNYQGKRYLESNESINEKAYKNDDVGLSICFDNLFKICDDEEIKEMAKYHYEEIKRYIINGKESEIYNEKKRVSNYYNNGWHYERVYDKTQCNIYN